MPLLCCATQPKGRLVVAAGFAKHLTEYCLRLCVASLGTRRNRIEIGCRAH
jgi:hypothetical protein